MVEDCIKDETDVVSLISADSDLIPPLDMILRLYPQKRVKVYFPPSNYCRDTADFLSKHKDKAVLMIKNAWKFNLSIMPFEIEKDGKKYTIPQEWKEKFEEE